MPEPASPELHFTQDQPRSLLIPALAAAVFLGLAFLIARHFFPATTVNIEHLHTDVLATTTTMKSNSIVLGATESSQSLFVVSNIRIDNQLQTQVFLDDFSLTLTDATGAQLTTKAVQKMDLASLETSFPALKPLDAHPLYRDTSIDPGKSAQGTIVFSLAIPKSLWDSRQTAVIEADIYHGHSVYIAIPK